jgi:hypothetical protein
LTTTAVAAAGTTRDRALRDQDITEFAFEKLTERLTTFGNVLTDAHRQALRCVLMRFTHLATGFRSGRWGYAMPCGSGKTEVRSFSSRTTSSEVNVTASAFRPSTVNLGHS